jgi:hypothetical protein
LPRRTAARNIGGVGNPLARERYVAARVDVIGLLIAVAGALAIGLGVAGIGYLLGAPAGMLGALTSAIVSGGVMLLYGRRQRRRAAAESGDAAKPPD